ncbi:zinc finger protein 235 isoform X2 [Plutella xylostella]|uniref:zinc finger protein 235 isoform X2 n=1 Tax=Plutella xylostella TaxID=51655 RepID=UPI0020331C32|nr:zinc finger protein 235 isoform X2 [Plutella xylostella]
MHYKTCEICGVRAGRIQGQKRIFMAKFPLDEERCKQWVKMTGKEDLAYVPIEKLHQLKQICGKHFLPQHFKKKGTQLKKISIPCVGLTAEPLADELLIGFPLHVEKTITSDPIIEITEPSCDISTEHNYCTPKIDECETSPVCDTEDSRADPLHDQSEEGEQKPDIDELDAKTDAVKDAPENMAKVSRVDDLEQCCHLCLSREGSLAPLRGSGLEEMLMDLFSLEVRAGDVPAQACGDCAARVSSAHSLQRTVRAATRHLARLLQGQCTDGSQNEITEPTQNEQHAMEDVQDTLQRSDNLSDDDSLPELPFEFEKAKHFCTLCNEKFKTMAKLNKHRHEVHGRVEEPYVCRYCGKVLSRSSIFKHERRHLKREGVLPMDYECKMCGGGFMVKAFWLRHLRVQHGGQRRPACAPCQRRFSTRDSYFNHLKEEHGDTTPYRCSLCHRAFEEKDRYENHMASRHFNKNRVRKRKAPFRKQQQMRRLTMQCEVCESRFDEIANLLEHYKTEHNITAVVADAGGGGDDVTLPTASEQLPPEEPENVECDMLW